MIGKNINYIIISLLLPAIGLMVYMNWCGLGMTSDSIRYLSEVELIQEKGIIYFLTNGPITFKPPGFALFVYLVGIQNLQWMFPVFFALILLMSWTLINEEIKNKFFQIIAILSIGYGIPFFLNGHFLWAEMPFIILLLMIIKIYLHSSNDRKKWIWIALMCAVLILLRYAGIFIVMAIVIDSMIYNRKLNNLITNVVVSVIAVSPIIIWFIFNPEQFNILIDNLFIRKETTLIEKGLTFFDGIALWFIPKFLIEYFRFILIPILLLYLFIVTKEGRPTIYLTLTSIYFLMITYSLNKVWSLDPDRFMGIIYIPIVLMGFVVMEFLYKKLNARFHYFFYVILIFFLVYPIVRTVKNVIFWHNGVCIKNID